MDLNNPIGVKSLDFKQSPFIMNPFRFAGLVAGSRGVLAGGGSGATRYNTIDYIDIDVTGNATDFGDLTVARDNFCGVCNVTRGVFCGGSTGFGDVIEIIEVLWLLFLMVVFLWIILQ